MAEWIDLTLPNSRSSRTQTRARHASMIARAVENARAAFSRSARWQRIERAIESASDTICWIGTLIAGLAGGYVARMFWEAIR